MEKIIVFTGAGISAESGIKTFRDSNGLWEEFNIKDVATPQAWEKNPALVLEFYNKRRLQVMEAKPNAAHYALVQLEEKYDVQIITQNIDDLHTRAGSSKVLHLHGEVLKARSTFDSSLYDIIGHELNLGDKCRKGFQLRPHVVWFGEAVPHMEEACILAAQAQIFIVIGTSLSVYPAAGLIDIVPPEASKYLIDPNGFNNIKNIHMLSIIEEKASVAIPKLVEKLLKSKG